MKKYFYLFIYAFVLFWLESAFQQVFPRSYFIPQLLILFITAAAISRDLKEVVWLSFLIGFLGELFSGLYFGTFISSTLLAAAITYFMTRNITSQDISFGTAIALISAQAILLPLWAWIFNLIIAGLGLVVPPPFSEFYSWGILWRIVVNMVCFLPINRLFRIFFNE